MYVEQQGTYPKVAPKRKVSFITVILLFGKKDGLMVSVLTPGVIVFCFWVRHFPFTMPHSTHVNKLVLVK